ncbi:hypothetical protein HZH68_006364 [Vespula germanica]|uniref:Uncharacterized protein n=1 Tax=Vespula germanica TaxID=30212 RepID=A0A834KBN2_VESGE|nr:hypothetical protein HZH68_006364 [Vespula germanica]
MQETRKLQTALGFMIDTIDEYKDKTVLVPQALFHACFKKKKEVFVDFLIMVEIQLEWHSDRNAGPGWFSLARPPLRPMINGENVPLMRSS